MPLYAYQCEACKKEHEVIQKFSDSPLKKCPFCGGRLNKKLTATSFQLKGGGWYKDGYSSVKPSSVKEKSSDSTTEKSEKKEKPAAEKK
ncbi:MAG: zinc ribbon domain-containing protein [Deltaproteobacteria bacterium]|nr:zinc ribbon domain-containing protein [Deltaproteobacteria bacterium]